MKRYLIFIYLMLFGFSLGFAQSGKIIDDIYVTPNDVQMINEVKASTKNQAKAFEGNQSAVSRNGAREIVFIDQYGNRTTAVSDTVYIVDGEVSADSVIYDNEEGYYLNEFNGSESDLEYAERIRRFHNPKYTITIADPGYNDIYFLDDDYWNVYVDGMYATVTPTWNNPYYWNYQWAPYSYSSWAWRHNWGYPSWGSYYGWGGYPWYSGFGYGGWYDPWYTGYYGWGGFGYGYGWGGYYGSYYDWGYPYYGWGGYYSSYDSRYDMGNRRGLDSSGRYTASGLRSDLSRRSAVLSSANGRSSVARSGNFTRVASDRNSLQSGNRSSVDGRNSTRSTARTAIAPSIDTRSRTGTVRSANDWNTMRNNRTYTTSGNTGSGRSSSTMINRTNPSTRSSSSSSVNSNRSSSTYNSGARSSSRSYESSRSSSNSYNSRSSESYSSPSRSSSSSGGSFGGGSSSSSGGGRSSSSGGGGSRR